MASNLELVKAWIRKAEHDLGMADLALENKPEYRDSICFHCQQAAEKCLKAYLVFLDVRFEKSHALGYLLDLINEKAKVPDALYGAAEELDGYGVEVRYPDDEYEPSLEDAREALNLAGEIKKFILGKLPPGKVDQGKGD